MRSLIELILQDGVTGPLAKINSSFDGLEKKVDGVGKGGFGRLSDAVERFKNKNQEAFSAIEGAVPQSSSLISALANPYAIAGAAVTALGVKSYSLATDWQAGMHKVNVTAQLSEVALQKVSDQVLGIAKNSYGTFEDVPQAFNRIISAGQDVPTALKTLEPTLKAAKAGFADVETTAAAAVGVMNASGIQDANRVYDILFATLNKGNAEFQDIAQYFPKIEVGARAAGFQLEEVGGAYAQLTANGFSAEQAATGLENTFKALSDTDIIKGGKKYKGLQGIGVQVFDAQGKVKPLINIVEQLKGKLDGLTDQQRTDVLGSIGFDMEASKTILSLTQNLENFQKTQDFVTKSQGQMNIAFEKSLTTSDKWAQVLNQLKGAGVQLGEVLIPIAGAIADAFLGLFKIIGGIVDGIKWAINGVSEALSGSAITNTIDNFISKDSRLAQAKNMIDQGNALDAQKYLASQFQGGQLSQAQDYFKNYTVRIGEQKVNEMIANNDNQGLADYVAKNYEGQQAEYMKQMIEKAKVANQFFGTKSPSATTDAKANDPLAALQGGGSTNTSSGLSSIAQMERTGNTNISGGGKEVRNVTVNNNFKSIFGTLENLGSLSKEDVVKIVTDFINRIAIGAEESMARN